MILLLIVGSHNCGLACPDMMITLYDWFVILAQKDQLMGSCTLMCGKFIALLLT